MNKKTLYWLAIIIGFVGMSLVLCGVFLEGGSLVQKILFLAGAVLLFSSALLNKLKMYIALQLMIIIGAILGFFVSVPILWKYLIMVVPSIVAVGYLVKIKHFKEDPWGVLGSAGLLSLAVGFATDAVSSPVLFNSLLAFGGVAIAIYSAIGFFYYKFRMSILWLILNAVFAVSPILYLISLL